MKQSPPFACRVYWSIQPRTPCIARAGGSSPPAPDSRETSLGSEVVLSAGSADSGQTRKDKPLGNNGGGGPSSSRPMNTPRSCQGRRKLSFSDGERSSSSLSSTKPKKQGCRLSRPMYC